MEAVIFIGLQASGKSSFYKERFQDTHVQISLDLLKTRPRERKLFVACLESQQPFVIDNTNPTPGDRARYIDDAKAAGYSISGYYFRSKIAECQPRNQRRPDPVRYEGVLSTAEKLELPTLDEGFDTLTYVRLTETGFVVEEWDAAADGLPD